MKVGHILNSSDTGGAQTLVEALAAHAGAGNEVHVAVLSQPGALAPRLEAAAASVTHLDSVGRTSDVVDLARGLRSWIERLRPDVVHSHLFQSNLLAAGVAPRQTPQVWTVHTSGHGAQDSRRTRAVIKVLDVAVRRADRLVACSPSAERWMRNRHWPADRIVTVPNGVAVRGTATDVERARSDYVLSLARAHEMKDHANLFAAFSQVDRKNLRLKCAGMGVDSSEPLISAALAPVADEVRDRIDLLGPVDDPSDLLRGAEASVVASSYGEALPMSSLESIAWAVPVVSTDVGDCSAAVTNPAHLVPPSDAPALARALTAVLALSNDDRIKLRAQTLELARSFDIDTVVAAYDEIYREVIRNG